eukprot:6136-Rhodomonas_salina.1
MKREMRKCEGAQGCKRVRTPQPRNASLRVHFQILHSHNRLKFFDFGQRHMLLADDSTDVLVHVGSTGCAKTEHSVSLMMQSVERTQIFCMISTLAVDDRADVLVLVDGRVDRLGDVPAHGRVIERVILVVVHVEVDTAVDLRGVEERGHVRPPVAPCARSEGASLARLRDVNISMDSICDQGERRGEEGRAEGRKGVGEGGS